MMIGQKNKNWDKLQGRSPGETLENRDVHGTQQLDRGTIQERRSNIGGVIAAVVVGVFVTIVVWALYSLVTLALLGLGGVVDGIGQGQQPTTKSYYAEDTRSGDGGVVETCYRALDQNGDKGMKCYDTVEQVPVPDWYTPQPEVEQAPEVQEPQVEATLASQLGAVTGFKLFLSLGSGLLAALVLGSWTSRRVAAANLMHDTSDINQHTNDQHIALPEEIQQNYDWFPDAGAHSNVQASSMLSHMMLQKKGMGTVAVARRATEDVYDKDGTLLYYAGEAMEDEAGEPVMQTLPMIDEQFGDDLFEASGLPKDKALRKKYDATRISYNGDGKNRDKLGTYKTVADLAKEDWTFPAYEVQRPGGAYIVDTAPVNTMVLAITRAGKGQAYIEPMLDMWSREKRPSNMVINDPKGELLVKNYIPFVTRGYEPVQFNLINAMKTDIYNPLGMAAEAAREGDSTKCALYVENIADVFFPLEGGEDPVWPNAANNAFKRAAYGLIDYYLEEERELRAHAAAVSMDPGVLEQRLDDMWGKVTLYNCYQLFVQLTSKKIKNPVAELEKAVKDGKYNGKEDELELEQQKAAEQAFLWEGKAEQDMLTLYFNATEELPTNTSRTLIANANNALRAMAGAEKMLASVYGIAITAMSFFTDPTISTLTSGKPSQNTDLGGLSFPRRLGVRFAQNYLRRDHLVGQRAVWSAYADPMFTQPLGKEFEHADVVSREGWARYYFEGKFPTDEAWLKLELVNPQSKMLIRTFYFHFRKSYQLSLNGRHFVVEPVTGRKIIKNGVLSEVKPERVGGTLDGQVQAFKPGNTTYPHTRLVPEGEGLGKQEYQARAIIQTTVRYSESPKAVFLVTPPHLTKYARIILILIKQLVDLNFDKSYMTKNNQKPLYRTRFMLDELGNLQSDGHGIANFETMLSIGLGQEQQFTLILQTLQQLREVYGESVDKIVQGNVSNIIFLKSTDDSMIETLEKMSGNRHVSRINSKQISQDMDKVIGGKTEGRVSYTMTTEKEPLISYNDMAFISPRNSIVFRAGDSPIWNRNETILPMSWRLLKDQIVHPGHDYSLQTIPTMSSALDFDVRSNQPDFRKMLDKRMRQAIRAGAAKDAYQESYGYAEVDIERLDPDVYADEVMEIISEMTAVEAGADPNSPAEVDPEDLGLAMLYSEDEFLENLDVAQEVAARQEGLDDYERKRYAQGTVSRSMLVNQDGSAKVKALDSQLVEAYRSVMVEMQRDDEHFCVGGDGDLRSADGRQVYISQERSEANAQAQRKLNEAVRAKGSRVYSEQEIDLQDLEALTTVRIHAAFYQFLASLPNWSTLADGHFDQAMYVEMMRD